MTTSKTGTDIGALLANAKADDNLSPAAHQALLLNDLGTQIQDGMGVSVDDVKTSDAIIVLLVVDNSSSIEFVSGNTEAVRDGVNLILQSLADTKQSESILVYCVMLNGPNNGLLYPFSPILDGSKHLDPRLKLNDRNYIPNGGTPLYDKTTVALGTAAAKVQEFAQSGVPARAITIIITDGADMGSRHHSRPEDVQPIVRALLASETHLVAFMGIDDGGSTNFRDVASRMGIQPKWVLTPAANPSAIRQACATVSQSAVRASQTVGTAFSTVVAGGFGG